MRLHRRSWEPEAPERVVLLVHGYAEHSGRYEELARWLAERGCVVHAYDHRGHGRSQGRRAHVERFDEFVDDLAAMKADVASRHPGLPLHIVGHSMGGLITAALLQRDGTGVHSAALSGPVLSTGGVSALRLVGARMLRSLLPTFALGSGFEAEGLTRDEAIVRAYLEDPLVSGNMTVSLACELLDAIGRVASRASDVATPLLLLHGDADPVCAPSGSAEFAARVSGSGLKLYPQLRHEIFNELERETVYQDVLDWFQEKQ